MRKTFLLGAVFVCISFLSVVAYSQTIAPFALRYSTSAKGSIDFVSNAILQCNGAGGGGIDCGNLETQLPPTFEDWSQNNDHEAEYIDIDGDASTFSSSSDSLDLATCSKVVFAGIYWGGRSDDDDPDFLNRGGVRIDANGDGYVGVAADVIIDAGALDGLGNRVYYCFADITAIVQGNPVQSLYTVADVYSRLGPGSNRWGGWNIVVVYENDLLPMRKLNVFDGLVNVNNTGTEVEVGISGFLTPASGEVTFEVGVYGYDGDRGFTGDSLLFDGGSGYIAVSDALNPPNDIFNFSQSTSGSVSTSQNPLKHNNISIDADIFEPDNSVFAYIGNSATSANVKVTTSNETINLQVITLAIDIDEPDIRAGVRVEDLNGGLLEPGDTLKYTVVGSNIGSDPSIDCYILDTLADNIEYVPESIEITFGPNSGLKTDVTGDDQAFYDAVDNFIRVNIGDFADDVLGGEVDNSPTGIDSTVFTFCAVVIRDCAHLFCDNVVENLAYIFATGEASGNDFTSESNPGTSDIDGCPVDGETFVVINITDCEVLSDTIVADYCEGVLFTDFPYDELGHDYFDDVFGPVIEADGDGTYFAVREVFEGCQDTIVITITEFLEEPTTADAGKDQGVCIASAAATLEGNDPLFGFGVWTLVTGAAVITDPTAFNSEVTGLTPIVNSFRWTITNGDCPESFDEVIITITEDIDGDGLCDVDDEDDDNDGIPDVDELDCPPTAFIPFNTPGYALDTDFNAGDTDAGTIENIVEFDNLTPPTPTNVDFNFSVEGIAEWNDGVELRNTGGLSPDGIHINVQAENTDFPNGDVAVYELVFSQPVYNLEFKWGGMDNEDATSFEAFNGVEVIELDADNIFNQSIPGPDFNLIGNVVISDAGIGDAPDNAVRIEIAGPVTSVLMRVGKDNSGGLDVTTQLFEMTYCTGYDPDGDGVPNHLDLDSDNDGVADILEAGGVDIDGDGVLDDLTDTDGDGLSDLVDTDDGGTPHVNPDSDSDDLLDVLDLDSDNDGLPDVVEAGGVDGDGDGVIDGFVDTDGDGLANEVDPDDGGGAFDNPDSDFDGINDRLDLDSDNDGTPDIIEAGGDDTNGDGRVDDDTDTDGDGFADLHDTDDGGTAHESPDTDDDDLDDYLDLDSDNDGIPDVIENGGADTNGDGVIDTYTDTDGDGFADEVDTNDDNTLGPDDGGIPLDGADTDLDGIPNYLDLDSDNDGILDIIEAGGTDDDSNGRVDDFEDIDADGYENSVDTDDNTVIGIDDGGTALVVPNTDGTGGPNFLDIDSDGDGIPDNVEGQPSDDYTVTIGTDTDGDGIDDAYDIDLGATPIDPEDTDSDGDPDYVDLDSENENESDLVEGHDLGGDGIPDTVPSGTDTDSDGLDDAFDTVVLTDITTFTNAGNGTIDPLLDGVLADADAPGIGDLDYRENDTDGDGISDSEDLDDDNDGILDLDEGDIDTDGDGVLDRVDLDSDNDGITDIIEAGGVDTDLDGRVDDDTDSDGDGYADTFDSDDGGTALDIPNTDGTGGLDYLDIDADGDGIPDNIEGQSSFGYTVASGADTDGDGVDDAYDADSGGTPIDPQDTDGDGLEDRIDLDSDDDDESDSIEGHDLGGDGIPDTVPLGTDSDNDGLDDAFDTIVLIDITTFTNAGNNTVDPLTDGVFADADLPGIGELDFREMDYDNDGIPDVSDLDDDNDGIPDLVEDLDEDGDGDPLTNPTDMDGDGIPDMFDLDSDNDGIPDIVEAGGSDDNGDGRIDDLNENGTLINDTDLDGLDDFYDADNGGEDIPNPDSDGDGKSDFQDVDSDNDGIYDRVEDGGLDEDNDGLVDDWADLDGDGIPDYADIDQTIGGDDLDGDGIDDAVQIGDDEDGDGIADDFDEDSNGDGWDDDDATDGSEDTDSDGIEDRLDLDSDNDGTPDILEDGGTDGNGDGRIDDFTDEDGDGADDDDMTDGLDDFDGDGVPDHEDLDSDNDGITDAEENGVLDDNGDGVIDDFNDEDGNGWDDDDLTTEQTDTNGDGIPDDTELDSDDDGIDDIIEADGTDEDGDGIIDDFEDENGDGLDDTDGGVDPPDTDGDGIDDYQDTDSDNDEVLDEDENDLDGDSNGPDDSDGDGIPDFRDEDDDNDGVLTIDEGDEDGDGVYDDCDFDGIPDYLDPDPCGLKVPSGFSPDGDGINDFFVIEGIQAYPNASLKIINRWGNRVYEIAGGYPNDWDGTNQFGMTTGSRDLPVGTYFYILDLGDGSEVIKGFVFINK